MGSFCSYTFTAALGSGNVVLVVISDQDHEAWILAATKAGRMSSKLHQLTLNNKAELDAGLSRSLQIITRS